MRAAAWTANRELEVLDKPEAPPAAGEVRVAIGAGGICGSDLHWYRGDFPPTAGLTPGHEIGGTVAAVGAGVDHVKEGDIVGVEPSVRCGDCEFCDAGHYQHCAKQYLIGIAADGGLAQSVIAPG